jgi:hypothetical protein
MKRIRGWVFLGIGFALAVWIMSCGDLIPIWAQSPRPLAQWTLQELQTRYDALNAQYWQTWDLDRLRLIEAELDPIREELTRRDLTALQANDAAFEALNTQIQAATAQIHAAAVRKWCHQTLWRRLRGYREPAWCQIGAISR